VNRARAQAYATERAPSRRTPWTAVPFCALDLETTGLDAERHEIVSWAVVPIHHGRVQVGAVREGLVRPRRPPKGDSVRIHGLRPVDLEAAPPLDEALDDLVDALRGRVVVVHADWVERSFVDAALRPWGGRLRGPVLDTRRLVRAWCPDLPPTLPLDTLAGRLGLPVHHPHTAAGDALTTAQVFVALATLLSARRCQTLGRLREAGCAHGGLGGLLAARFRL
jgi:DNA polymerase-3 subunit epsilon